MSRQDQTAKEIVTRFWGHFNAREWRQAKLLLADDFEAHWPQSRELIKGRDNFIEVNQTYPGTHNIEVQEVKFEYDRSDLECHVTTVVYIVSKMPDGKELNLFAVSFFVLNSEKQIKSATEYWADTSDAPEWRKHLVERY